MEINKALSQISEIHGQLAKTEIYKSYKSFPIALSGLFAIAIAMFQPKFIHPDTPLLFVGVWTAVAALCLAMSGAVILYNYIVHEGTVERRTTLKVVGQFAPSVAAGALVTLAVVTTAEALIPILPGCWAVIFALGVFSARPYLPRVVGWVALFYLAAGALLLLFAADGRSLSPWGMGATFGVGQLFAAIVLYWNLERDDG